MASKDGAKDAKSSTSQDEDDNLYYTFYAAGVLFVILSLTFNGCLFYSCSTGVSNFGTSLWAGFNPSGGKFLGKFNETAQCEEACHTYVGGTCYAFTFFTYGSEKSSLDGNCFGATTPRYDPIPFDRSNRGPAVTGIVSTFSNTVRPLVTWAYKRSMRPSILVAAISDIRRSVKEWPLVAVVSEPLMTLSEKAQSDLWKVVYLILLVWPFVHQLLVDRYELHQALADKSRSVPVKSLSAIRKEKSQQADKKDGNDNILGDQVRLLVTSSHQIKGFYKETHKLSRK